MMNRSIVLAAYVALTAVVCPAWAGNCCVRDTIYSHFDLKEVSVSSSVKQIGNLSTSSLSSTTIEIGVKEKAEVRSLKNISGKAPNFFMPDYGTSLTSAIYIRGIGSRINTPAVGLYVDDMPYIDKSAFSFNFADIKSIEVLRGPQCTLYGRNAMGGLIHIYTQSPFQEARSEVAVSYTDKAGGMKVSLSHRRKLSERLAMSGEAFYNRQRGYFHNDNLDIYSDHVSQVGGRLRMVWLAAEATKADFTLSYEHTDEGGYAYEYRGMTEGAETMSDLVGKINSNRESTYWRSMVNAGAKIQHQLRSTTLTSMTSFQLLNDMMSLDQDFLPTDTFELDQGQRQRTVTQELTLKNRSGMSFMGGRWVVGAFAYHQWVDIDSPVRFNRGGVQMIQRAMDDAMQEAGAPVEVKLDEEGFEIAGLFTTPAQGAALYGSIDLHPSEKWQLTAGVRIDYEQLQLEYNTRTKIKCDIKMDGGWIKAFMPVEYTGDDENSYLNVLPKVSARYSVTPDNVIYMTVSKGYRSGGFNVQMFSDVVSASFKGSSEAEKITDEEIASAVSYSPEICWNYEVGTHLKIWDKVRADISVFVMRTKDQQVARFAPGGLGREVVNAGKSKSAGVEASLRYDIVAGRLTMNADYGLTESKFTDYAGDESYNGNYVPFVPRQTGVLSVEGVITKGGKRLKRLTAEVTASHTGEIYWTEENGARQGGYTLLEANMTASLSHVTVTLWGKNLGDKAYDTFYFESMNHRFAQRGKPLHVGIEARVTF